MTDHSPADAGGILLHRDNRAPFVLPVSLAFLLVGASFVLQGHLGLNLADEGLLWHGVMRVLNGDVPVRDFQSYDPGRYYWSAFWLRLSGGDGIMALRLTVALFQACSLAVALLMLRRVMRSPLSLVLAALALMLWFVPRHKLFDLSLSIFAVHAGMALLDRPTLARHFAAGLYIGIAAVFGRNHGFYAALALSGLAFLAWVRLDRARPVAKLLMLGAGTLAGYSPMFVLALSQPGFFQAVADTVLAMFRSGATNLAIPVPWPWAVDYAVPLPWALHRLFVGLAFVAMPAFYAAAFLFLLRERRAEAIQRNSLLVAGAAVGVVYMHYAFARADVGHLAHAIFPFLLAVLALPAALRAAPAWMEAGLPAALLAMSVFAAGMVSPFFSIGMESSVRIDVRGDRLEVDAGTARAVQAVQKIAAERVGPAEQIVFAPYWPTMYAVIGRISPVWETYSTSLTSDENEQRRFVRDLDTRQVEWAVIGNALLDGRDDRRFSNTHPIVWRYLGQHYEAVPVDGLPPDHRLLRRRSVADPAAGASRLPRR